jgi:hypothetical protein
MSSEGHTIPSSIFLDDVNTRTTSQEGPSNETNEPESADENASATTVDDIDQLLDFPDTSLDIGSLNENDDETVPSTTSSSIFPGVLHQKDFTHAQCQEPNSFDQVTCNEMASFKIMSLLDSSGCPRNCYDRLIALLKRLSKTDGFDVKKAINRETLMKRLGRKYKTRPQIQSSVINKQEVLRFCFVDMLQDLVNSSSNHLHDITPGLCPDNLPPGTEHELWNTGWMRDTFQMPQYERFDPNHDIMLPLILYMDKTGTDVNLRYSLEPVLFSLAAIPRVHRESRHSWRHLGFVPQKQSNTEEESASLLQFYHDCLSFLMEGLKEAQENPPILTVRLKNGCLVHRRALLPLMIVMGDQLSQDTLCARLKSNAGGAGRVHRSCMCSYLNIDDPYHECKPVDIEVLNWLNTNALRSDQDIESMVRLHTTIYPPENKEERSTKMFLQRQRAMYRSILRNPFTTHPIKNAFKDINFGSWKAGIHDATFDDFMHSVEGGMVSYITETVYDGLTKREKETVEELTRPILAEQRCSVVSHYPRWRLQPGFTRQTMMTSGERVGSLLALSLSLNNPTIRETIRSAHTRQIQKYLDCSTESKNRESDDASAHEIKKLPSTSPDAEFYLNQHMHTLDDNDIRHTIEHMIRHGFNISLVNELDAFQINQMIWHCAEIFRNTSYPENYPTGNIEQSYTDYGQHMKIPKKQLAMVKLALQTKPSKLLKNHRHHKIDGTVRKHHKKKPHRKGDGSTAAVLTNNMGTLAIFLEYVLCYHAFCKYSWSLPVFLQRQRNNIMAGNRFVVQYFQKLIYRGNSSVDSRFPKIHAQCRMGQNTEKLNTVMNSCCETGERLLKTEAKGISRTAQQRGNETFLTQTMCRIMDRSLVDSLSHYLDNREKRPESIDSLQTDQFGRTHPHFVYNVDTERIFAVDRKNEAKAPDEKSGNLNRVVTDALKKHEPHTRKFEIYNEVILRDNSRVRASPNYSNSGPWYDYANVSWEKMVNGVVETYLLPAKCFCFYRSGNEQYKDQEIMALIHTVDQSSQGNISGRPDTLLTRNYRMQFTNKGEPVTHVVPVASIDAAVRCFPHVATKELFDSNSPGITYLLPRNHWSYMWMAINDSLMECNSINKVAQRKGKLISLCSHNWLNSVRERYHKYLNATSTGDLNDSL